MNRYAEWVHCNKCMEFSFKKENEILIGECGHFCCKKCLLYAQNQVQSQNYCCAVCGSNDGIWCSLLGNNLSLELKKVIVPIHNQIQDLMGIWEFQESNTNSIIMFLKQAAGSMQLKLIQASEALEKSKLRIRELQNANRNLEIENQNLKMGMNVPITLSAQSNSPSNLNQPSPRAQQASPQRFSLKPTSRDSSYNETSFNPQRIHQPTRPSTFSNSIRAETSQSFSSAPYYSPASSLHSAASSGPIPSRPTSSQSQQSARTFLSKLSSNPPSTRGPLLSAQQNRRNTQGISYNNQRNMTRSASNRSLSSNASMSSQKAKGRHSSLAY